MFKVNDVVRRKKEHRCGIWFYHDREFVVSGIPNPAGLAINLEGLPGNWESLKFELVKPLKTSYPCIREIPKQEARRQIQSGKLLDSSFFVISPSDLDDNRIIIQDYSASMFKKHYLSERELRETASAFLVLADVLKETGKRS